MTPRSLACCTDIKCGLAGFLESLTQFGPFEDRVGYRCGKVLGRNVNWLQWNNGDRPLPIHFENDEGDAKTWKLFARFARQPRVQWEKVHWEPHRWVLGGPDVWGYSCDALLDDDDGTRDVAELLREDLAVSYRYATRR